MTVGEMIKELRISMGLTQKQLGEICGMADSAIRRYESGRANPKLDTLKKIADALGVTIDILLGDNWTTYLPNFLDEKSDDSAKDTPKAADSSTIAAHFDGSEYTEEELEEIKKFAEFVKSKRKDQK